MFSPDECSARSTYELLVRTCQNLLAFRGRSRTILHLYRFIYIKGGFHLFRMHLVQFMGDLYFYYGWFPGLMLRELYSDEGESNFAEWGWNNRKVMVFFL